MDIFFTGDPGALFSKEIEIVSFFTQSPGFKRTLLTKKAHVFSLVSNLTHSCFALCIIFDTFLELSPFVLLKCGTNAAKALYFFTFCKWHIFCYTF